MTVAFPPRWPGNDLPELWKHNSECKEMAILYSYPNNILEVSKINSEQPKPESLSRIVIYINVILGVNNIVSCSGAFVNLRIIICNDIIKIFIYNES